MVARRKTARTTRRSPPRPTRARVDRAGALVRSVDAAFQSYADRGVFRGFTIAAGPGGVRTYRFIWLTTRPMIVRLVPRGSRLTFPDLLPAVATMPGAAADVLRVVRSRSSRDVPAHKRIDGRRLAMTSGVRRGAGWLSVEIKGPHGEYAVRTALAVINDLFLVLHECHPEYLVAHFGLSSE